MILKFPGLLTIDVNWQLPLHQVDMHKKAWLEDFNAIHIKCQFQCYQRTRSAHTISAHDQRTRSAHAISARDQRTRSAQAISALVFGQRVTVGQRAGKIIPLTHQSPRTARNIAPLCVLFCWLPKRYIGRFDVMYKWVDRCYFCVSFCVAVSCLLCVI